jgi:hypothetical protein
MRHQTLLTKAGESPGTGVTPDVPRARRHMTPLIILVVAIVIAALMSLVMSVLTGSAAALVIGSWLMMRWRTKCIRDLHRLHSNIRRALLQNPLEPFPLNRRSEYAYLDTAFTDLASRLEAEKRKTVEILQQHATELHETECRSRRANENHSRMCKQLHSVIKTLSKSVLDAAESAKECMPAVRAAERHCDHECDANGGLAGSVRIAGIGLNRLVHELDTHSLSAQLATGQFIVMRKPVVLQDVMSSVCTRLAQMSDCDPYAHAPEMPDAMQTVYADPRLLEDLLVTLCARFANGAQPGTLKLSINRSASTITLSVRGANASNEPARAARSGRLQDCNIAYEPASRRVAGTHGIIARALYAQVGHDAEPDGVAITLPLDTSAAALRAFERVNKEQDGLTKIVIAIISMSPKQSIADVCESVCKSVGPYAFLRASDDGRTIVAADDETRCTEPLWMNTEGASGVFGDAGVQLQIMTCSRTQAGACILNALAGSSMYELRGAA